MVKILHNPRCRKSREGLQFLRDNDIETEVVEYLKTPLTERKLVEIANKLQLRPKDFIRKQEKAYKELRLKEKLEDDASLFSAMVSHPKLIERPIIINENKAVIGRPATVIYSIL